MMGLFKIIYYVITTTSITVLVLNYLPNTLDIEPQAYTPKLLKYEGALAVNKELDKAEFILENQILAPESLLLIKDEIYASVEGKILKIKDEKIVGTLAHIPGGRPLGLRLYKDEVYVADMRKGILKIDIKTGKVTVLVDPMETIGGRKNNYPNDLDVHDGIVYFSVPSTKWDTDHAFYGMMEYENSGRLCKYDIATGKTDVLADNLYGPNGLQVAHDKKAVLFSELWNNRILRYYLVGPKKGNLDVFVDLPGKPDNMRSSSSGGYWIPIITSRDISSPELVDRLTPYPKIRKALARLSYLLGSSLSWINQYISWAPLESFSYQLESGMIFLLLKNVDHPILVKVDENGNIIRSLHSSNPKFCWLSQGQEYNGYLYLGSFRNPYMVKLKL